MDGNVTILFEREAGQPGPKLEVYGSDGKGSIPSGCGIDVQNEGIGEWPFETPYPISLTVKGVGKLIAQSGDVYDDAKDRTGGAGNDGFTFKYTTSSSGKGGTGGNGTAGVSAAIGTLGAKGGKGASAPGSVSADIKSEKDGVDGNNAGTAANSRDSGKVTFTGAISVDARCGVLKSPETLKAASAGTYSSTLYVG